MKTTHKKNDLSWLILWLAVILALMARFIYLGKIPWGLYWDEMAMSVDLKALLATGKDMHGLSGFQLIFPSYGDYKLPVYLWAAWLSAKLFGLSAFSLRLVSALAGVLTAFIAGLIALKLTTWHRLKSMKRNKIWRRWLFLSTVLAVSFSPWSFLFSRTAFEAHLSQFFLALAVYFLLLFQPTDKWKRYWLVAAIFVGDLSIYTYYATRFVWPIVLVIGLGLKMRFWFKAQSIQIRQMKHFSRFLAFAVSLILFSLLATFLILLPLRNSSFYQASQQFRLSTNSIIDASHTSARVLKSNRYRQLAGNSKLDRLFFHRYWLLMTDLAKNISANSSLNTLFLQADPNLRHSTGVHGLFLLSFLPFLLFGFYLLAKTNWSALTILLGWWLMALLPASVPNEVPHALRSLNALVPLSIVIGFGLATFFVSLEKWSAGWHGRLLKLITALILITNFAIFVNYYFKHYPLSSAQSWQVNYQRLAQLIYQHRPAKQAVVVFPPEDRFYLWLMADGSYNGAQFAQWPEKNFLKTGFDQIQFQRPKLALDRLLATDQPFLLAGNQEKLLNLIRQEKIRRQPLCFLAAGRSIGQTKPMVCLINQKKNQEGKRRH